MEIAVMTCFSAEGDMKVDACQGVRINISFTGLSAKVSSLKWLIGLVLTLFCHTVYSQFALNIKPVDRDPVGVGGLNLAKSFSDRQACIKYIEQIPASLLRKGYATASIDSMAIDSTEATVYLYVGHKYHWGEVRVYGLLQREFQQTGVLLPKTTMPFSSQSIEKMEHELLLWLSDNGFPFAKVKLDSVRIHEGLISASLVVDKGMPYVMDSIRVNGNVKISEKFLHRYLDLPKGGPYKRKTFDDVSPRLRELPFLREKEPWVMHFGGNGAVLDLYLEQQRSSQVNVLIGLLPTTGTDGKNKLQFTGEATLNLKNALGNGETIGLNWQQLQVKSPRLNLLYQQPYLFGSAFGISTQFDLFKKDSSFLNINGIIGLQYALSARQSGKVFLQLFRTNLVSVDTQQVKQTHRLPADMDMGIYNLGVDYDLFTTNYRRNPRKGWEVFGSLSAGTRTIKRNNGILEIKDPTFNYASLYDTVDLNSYQFRIKGRVAKYFPIGKQSAVQLLATGGWVQSPSLYRNELFQLGGYKLLRGFDEESIYASSYLVNTLEYRYLVGMNSYFFVFTDLGFTANKSSMGNSSNNFLGAGIGIAFETTAGFFNLSLAAGKRDDTKFNLRQTKIHLGYVNYF